MSYNGKSRDELAEELHQLQLELRHMTEILGNADAERLELAESEKRYRSLVELAADTILMGDHHGNIIGANHSAAILTGYSNDELIGMNISRLFSEEELQRVPLRYDLIKKGMVVQSERELFRKDGTTVAISMNSKMMPDGTYHTFMRDVTERKKIELELREREEQLRIIFETSQAGIILVDPHGVITFANNRMADMFGCTMAELVGSNYTDHLHPQEKDVGDTRMRQLINGEIDHVSLERRYLHKDGSDFWGYLSGRRLAKPDGQLRALVGIIADITERKAIEEEVREANRELETFTYTVSHDLRTPLTSIIGYAEFLGENYRERLDERGLDILAEIGRAGEKMSIMMEDLLALAKAGCLERPAKPVVTSEVVTGVITDMKNRIETSGIVVQVSRLPSLRVPKTVLSQVFDNLIGNALSYAGKNGGPLEVGGERSKSRVRFFVRDHGPGIPEKERGRIFELFFRGAAEKKSHGTGLGLAIVQKIARAYGGRAWLEETEGGGCTFWVEMEEGPSS